jgi:acetolactate synthase I/III small subunit
MRRAILAFMLDRPGVLNKVSMLIRRKMYNVDTLTVCPSRVKGISRMTITLQEDRDAQITQVIKQLEKITEVISVKELNAENSYWREAAIVKLEIDSKQLQGFRDRFNFELLDQKSEDLHIIQVAGSTKQIDNFLDEIGREYIVEIARTGVTALEK